MEKTKNRFINYYIQATRVDKIVAGSGLELSLTSALSIRASTLPLALYNYFG